MKTKRFGLVLSNDEKRILSRLAKAEGLSEAAVLRVLIRRTARKCGLWSGDDSLMSVSSITPSMETTHDA